MQLKQAHVKKTNDLQQPIAVTRHSQTSSKFAGLCLPLLQGSRIHYQKDINRDVTGGN